MLDAKIPAGPLDDKWTDYKGHCKLVNPANKRKLEVLLYIWLELGCWRLINNYNDRLCIFR